ncbi:unnamed protein product [Staurois parvus]|uniref:Uncharacterized protein n=1 Tax=Staurois parvus TaxID=386267 RepID=A0ABN9CH81_9NEOB|nr:unnamed protein product [Staurois parvus]
MMKKKKKMKKKMKMQMSAVDLRITAHFTHFGQSRGQKPECGATVWRWRQQQWEAIQHPMKKNGTHQQCEET